MSEFMCSTCVQQRALAPLGLSYMGGVTEHGFSTRAISALNPQAIALVPQIPFDFTRAYVLALENYQPTSLLV